MEADERSFGGTAKNKHARKRLRAGRGGVGTAIVAGVKDRDTGHVSAAVVPDTRGSMLRRFVRQRTQPDAMVFTDEASAYVGLAPSRRRQAPA